VGIIWDNTKNPRERWDFKVVIRDDGPLTLIDPTGPTREPLTVPPPALVVADLALEMSKAEVVDEPESTVVPYSAVVVVPLESDTSPSPTVYNL